MIKWNISFLCNQHLLSPSARVLFRNHFTGCLCGGLSKTCLSWHMTSSFVRLCLHNFDREVESSSSFRNNRPLIHLRSPVLAQLLCCIWCHHFALLCIVFYRNDQFLHWCNMLTLSLLLSWRGLFLHLDFLIVHNSNSSKKHSNTFHIVQHVSILQLLHICFDIKHVVNVYMG